MIYENLGDLAAAEEQLLHAVTLDEALSRVVSSLTKRFPLRLIRIAPLPRTASVIRMRLPAATVG